MEFFDASALVAPFPGIQDEIGAVMGMKVGER